jgi:Holliday junction DNA helicase RuvB
MGKTKLARALAVEYGTACRVVHGRASPADVCAELVAAQSGDFVFLDEAHALPRDAQIALFQVIDVGRAKDWLGDKDRDAPRDEDGQLVIQPICVILATDQPGELLDQLKNRMEIRQSLADYREQELIEIGAAEASELGLTMTTQAVRAVAKAAQGQPRRVKQMLGGMRRHFHEESQGQLEEEDVRRYLRWSNMDAWGLDDDQQRYLTVLHNQRRASLYMLSRLLGVDPPFVQSDIEPGLAKLGFIRIGAQGRRLTRDGLNWVRDRRPAAEERRSSREDR